MKFSMKTLFTTLALLLATGSAHAVSNYSSYSTKTGFTQGGSTLFVKSGGTINIQSGGELSLDSGATLDINGTCSATNIDAGASAEAGTVDIFPTTASKGKTQFTATDNTGNTTTTITNAAQAGAVTYTIPDYGSSANFVLAGAASYKVDGIAMSTVKCVDSTVTAALLDSAGAVTVITGVTGDQWKIREVFLTGGGTSYAAGGNRTISLTDGTTTWTTIANADIESAPSATLRWGDTKVPFLTSTSNTKSASNADIKWMYAGGTTDHSATGSFVLTVCAEKTN